MLDEFKIFQVAVDRLNSARIPYMISGSVAMNYYTQPRMTRDIDIVIALSDVNIQKFCDIFRDDFYLDINTIKEAVKNEKMFNIIHLEEVIKIDFIIRKSSEYRKFEFERRKKIKIDDQEVFITTIEDLILSKLAWAKESYSEIQLLDVKNLLQENANL